MHGMERKRKHWTDDDDDDDAEEEEDQSHRLRKLPDRDLKRQKESAEKILADLKLKDGGQKMRALLNRIKSEMKRRGLLLPKDSDTCIEVIPVTTGSTFAAATEGFSTGAPLTVPDSQVTWSFHAGRDMDDKTGHEESGAFKENLPTMKSCNHKNDNVDWDPPSHITDDIGLSPRKTSLETSQDPVNIGESSVKL